MSERDVIAQIRPGMTQAQTVTLIVLALIAALAVTATVVLIPWCVSAVREANRQQERADKLEHHLRSADDMHKRMLRLGKHLDAVGFLDTMGAMSEATPDDHECVRKFRDALRQSVSAAEAARSSKP